MPVEVDPFPSVEDQLNQALDCMKVDVQASATKMGIELAWVDSDLLVVDSGETDNLKDMILVVLVEEVMELT